MQSNLELKARMLNACPKCGAKKESGEHSQIVCWGDCWRGVDGLKYTALSTVQWLLKYTNLK